MASARIKAYQTFGDLWGQHIHPYKAQLPLNRFPCTAEQKDGYCELDAMIHLPKWPEQAKIDGTQRHRREIDILVHARERFSVAKPHVIEESKVTVSYFRTVSNPPTATHLSTVRYDYDLPLRPSHPLFHFHCCRETVPQPNAAILESWRFEITQNANEGQYPFRVPTPHMSLCSVLLGLVAEHLDPEKFRALWKAITQKDWQPPAPAKAHLWERCKQNAEASQPFHNWQWYFWADE